MGMEMLALRLEERSVGRLLGQTVLEDEREVIFVRASDKLVFLQPVQGIHYIHRSILFTVHLSLKHLFEYPHLELPPYHGSDLESALGIVGQPVDAGGQHSLQRIRYLDALY